VKRLAILGSTGSIGRSALAVVDAHPAKLQVTALAAGDNASLLGEQVVRYRPTVAAIANAAGLERLRAAVGSTSTVLRSGPEALVAVATQDDVDIVICASAGTAGLEAVLAAIEAGKTIALANKEVLVMAGELVTEAARRRGVSILPVDSEHNATVDRRAGASWARSRASPSDMADGSEDYDRFRNADEQGAGSDRGALAVRR
jgi:1-deoxy-D-xylulose-5-phosphate reductoisomerase